MSWLKNNLGMLLSGLLFTGLLGFTGWQIHQAFGKRAEVESTLQAKQEKIQQLRGAKIFPSKENIEALRHDRLQLLQLYSNIQAKVSHTIVTTPPIKRDVEFNLFLVETQSKLRKAGNKNSTNLVSHTFGFGRYYEDFPCRLARLRGTDCEHLLSSLTKQIIIVDKITRMLFESGTEDILDIKRAQITQEAVGTDTIAWTPPMDPKTLFVAMPFEFKFACEKTQVLQTFLNKLATSDLFFVVRNLTVATESQVKADPNTTMNRLETTPESIAKTEVNHRLIVTAHIDWVEFAPTTTNTTATIRK